MLVQSTLTQAEYHIFNFLEKFLASRYWALKTTACLAVLAFITAYPPYTELDWNTWDLMKYRAEHMFAPIPSEFISSHSEKYPFRITVPLIGRILHLNAFGFLLFSQASGLFLLYAVQITAFKITTDRIASFLVGLGVSCIFIGKYGFYDIYGQFDTFAIFLLILAIHTRSSVAVFLFVLAASYCDERAFIASSLVFVWWKVFENGDQSIRALLVPKKYSAAVLLGWAVYGLTRWYIQRNFGISTGTRDIGLHVLLYNFKFAPLAFLLSLEGFWGLHAIAIGVMFKTKRIFQSIMLAASVLTIYIVALMVFDVSRSTSYLLPSVFICLYLVWNEETPRMSRRILLAIACINFLVPTMEFFNQVYWLGPIFPKILKSF